MKKPDEKDNNTLFSDMPTDIQETFEVLHGRLKDICLHLEEPQDLSQTLSDFLHAIDIGNITEEKVSDLHADCLIPQNRQDRLQAAFYLSCIAYLHAKKQLDSATESATWPMLCHASYLIGRTEAEVTLFNELRWKSERALPGKKLGGRASTERYDPLRTRMIELLESLAPEGGWKTKKQAADAIYADLEGYASDNPNLDIKTEDFHRLVTNWLKSSGNKEINIAYMKSASKGD